MTNDRNDPLFYIPYKNIFVYHWKPRYKNHELLKSLSFHHNSIENIQFKSCIFEDSELLGNALHNLQNLNSIGLESCSIRKNNSLKINKYIFSNLKSVSFCECDENLFDFFNNQTSIIEVTIAAYKKSWHGFSHEAFDKLARTLPNLRTLVFKGDGTGSYFDRNSYPKNIEILIADMITFHWYIGITGARTKILDSLLTSLKELRINHLPSDFDGGRVMKYICERMNLETFYYGDIPLILNKHKQKIKHFSAAETQIQAAFEMFRQFPGSSKMFIKIFKFFFYLYLFKNLNFLQESSHFN